MCGPGELVGELSSVDGRPRSATAVAIESIDARVISGAEFRDFLGSHAGAAVALLASICRRLRASDRRQVEFVALDSVGRVARRLVEMAEQYGVAEPGGVVRIDVPITQDDLAGWTDSSREAVVKALHWLRGRGWIETGRRSVRVLDISALRSRAMGSLVSPS
jgi:CRP-like cAMP-binding protein